MNNDCKDGHLPLLVKNEKLAYMKCERENCGWVSQRIDIDSALIALCMGWIKTNKPVD